MFFKRDWTPSEWEGEVFRLLSQRPLNGGVQRVPPNHKGDWGVDFYCIKSGEIFQCYSPEEPTTGEKRFEKQRDKITRDIAKLIRNDAALVKIGGRGWIRRWTLAIPVFDDKRLLVHAAEKQRLVRGSATKAITPEFTILIAAHRDLERESIPSGASEFHMGEIVEGLRPVLYRSKFLRDSRRMEKIARESGLYNHFAEETGQLRSDRVDICVSAIQRCLLTRDFDSVRKFVTRLSSVEQGEVRQALDQVLEAKLFSAEKSIPVGLGKLDEVGAPIFSFPKPRFFVGRGSLLSELIKAVQSHRLVTVFGGIGGLGKTTLACEAASALQQGYHFPDGVIFVDLEEATSAQSVMLSVGKRLALRGAFTVEEVIRILEKKRLLLIIDNIETVLARDRMAFRKLIARILDYTTATLLCTGRESINLPDEKLIRPKPLDRQEAEDLLEYHLTLRLGDYPKGTRPKGFDTALDICDGIPLAIELVASWLPGHSLDAYVTEFNRARAAVLRNPSLETGDRLTNYVVSTHLTYHLLPAHAQELLRFVSMLPAAPKLEMLLPLLDGQQLMAVRELENRSLIYRDDSHIKVLIPVREAIRPLVGINEVLRLASHILAMIPSSKQVLEDFVLEQHTNLTWSIVNLVTHSGEEHDLSRLIEIVLNLEDPYIRTGLLGESREILEALVSRFKAEPNQVPFRLHCFRGNVERLLDNYTASESCYSEALKGDKLGGLERVRVLIGQGNVQKQIQKYSEAEGSFQEALDLSLSLGGDPALQGECLWGLANVEFATSRWNQAKTSYVRALHFFEQARPSPETLRGIIDCHKGLCDIYIKQRSLHEAEAAISAAHAIFYDPYFEFRNRFTEAKIQQGLGDVKRLMFVGAKQKGNLPRDEDYGVAEEAYRKAIQIYHEMKAPIGEALSYYKLGELCVFLPAGEERARGWFLTAAAIFDQCGNHLGRAKANLALLKLDVLAHGARHRFLERAHELLGVFRDICQSIYWQAEAHLTIAACRKRNNTREISRDLAEASRLFSILGRDDKLEVVEMVRVGHLGLVQMFWE